MEEPDPPLGLIQDLLEQVAGRGIAVLVADLDRRALVLGHATVVLEEPADHLVGRDEFLVVVRDRLELADLADAPNRRAADLAQPFGQPIDRFEDALRLLVEEQMVVAEMGPAHVPVKVFRLHVQREGIRDQRVDRIAYVPDLVRAQISGRREWPRNRRVLHRASRHLVSL